MINQIEELTGHTDRVWHVSWSPSIPIIASCSTDKSVRMYSFTPTNPASSEDSPSYSQTQTKTQKSYRFSHQSTIPNCHSRTIRSLAFSPTGCTLATASFDSTVGIWQQVEEAGVDDGEETGGNDGNGSKEWEAVDPLEGHESECKSVEWSSDGRLLASCSRDKSVWVWEAIGPAEFECLAVLMEHSQDVKAVTWHPSEELLASASYDDTIKLFAADAYDDEWTCIHTLISHTATVWTISFSPCGNYLVSGGDDLILKIWGRNRQGGPETLGEDGEATREEGGRMGPWSRGGVRIGEKEKWSWTLKCEIKEAHLRTIYSADWGVGGISEEESGLGRIVTGGGDGRINVFQITKPVEGSAIKGAPVYSLIETIESSHGVSDVNHVSWCKLSPEKAAATLRNLEGGEEAEENMEVDEKVIDTDPRWIGCKNIFASAGDDSTVRIWEISN